MDITIYPGKLSGAVDIIPSKSQAHRFLICAAFSDKPTKIICPATNEDIEATASCLNSLGANVTKTTYGYFVKPITELPDKAVLDCRESGSTLRFLLPVIASLGTDTTFLLGGRLPQRPLSPLWEELERMGCHLSRPTENTLRCCGRLQAGAYSIDGSVSSQFISGLLFALAILPEKSTLTVTGNVESKPYIAMTEKALEQFGVCTKGYCFDGTQAFTSPREILVEGDWSNGAFFLAAEALGNSVRVNGLNPQSSQGDRIIQTLLSNLSDCAEFDGQDYPDLIPILAVVAGAKKGAVFHNIGRLRLKESDRIRSVSQMLKALGAKVNTTETSLTVSPSVYHQATVQACNDHRIAMAAAIAATVSTGPVTISGAECVRKSYPDFWSEFQKLGGKYEHYTR